MIHGRQLPWRRWPSLTWTRLGLAGSRSGRPASAACSPLGGAWRAQRTLPLIAVTGSQQRTTVTQMIAAILRAWRRRGRRLATEGNLNNHIGVPMTLLRLAADCIRVAVVERITTRARIAPGGDPWPWSRRNQRWREHQEFMPAIEAVARERTAMFIALIRQIRGVLAAMPARTIAVAPNCTARGG